MPATPLNLQRPGGEATSRRTADPRPEDAAGRAESARASSSEPLLSVDGGLNASVHLEFSPESLLRLGEEALELAGDAAQSLGEGVEAFAGHLAGTLREGSSALEALGDGAQMLGREAGETLLTGGSVVFDAAGTLGRYALMGALLAGGVLHESV